MYIFEETYAKRIDTWDSQLTYTVFKNDFLSVVPVINLVSNIGFGSGSHTFNKKDKYANLETGKLNFPLGHPAKMISYDVGDNYENNSLKLNYSLAKIVLRKLGLFNFIKKIYKYVM